MAKTKPQNSLVGRWLIDSMEKWGRSFIDLQVRGYFEFDANRSGHFQFGCVQGQIDYRLDERNGKPAVEFTWDGYDEADPAQGRGWMVLEGNELSGRVFIHFGEDSGIVLKREPESSSRTKRTKSNQQQKNPAGTDLHHPGCPDATVGLKLTAGERKLILEDLRSLDATYAQVIRATPKGQLVQLTLDQWQDLAGTITEEANDTEDKRLERNLDFLFAKVWGLLDAHAEEPSLGTLSLEEARQAKQIATWVIHVLGVAEQLGIIDQPLRHLSLAPAEKEVLQIAVGLRKNVKDKLAQQEPAFTFAEAAGMVLTLAQELPGGDASRQVAILLVLKHLMERLQEGVHSAGPLPTTPATTSKRRSTVSKTTSATIYQFKISLQGIQPPIWRRIQTKDCSLDKLHEHIQTAMGWTNSHLHQFQIGDTIYGDPELLYEGWQDETPPVNSRRVKISKIVPANGQRLSFLYEYDFGDDWQHEIVFEGCPQAEQGTRYPRCVEGERACPPEDVGGTYGYQEYFKTLSDPEHLYWEATSEWRGPFRPEHFDAQQTSKAMQQGLPNWRGME